MSRTDSINGIQEWSVHFVRDERLRPWVHRYLVRCGESPNQTGTLRVFPRGGSSLFLDFNSPFSKTGPGLYHGVNGIHGTHYFLSSMKASVMDQMIVEFSPEGLSRFTRLPVPWLHERLEDADLIFEKRSSRPSFSRIYERMQGRPVDERLNILETFLIQALRPAGEIDLLLSHIIKEMVRTGRLHDHKSMEKLTSLSLRQMERRFKETTGISRRALYALLRFEKARERLDALQKSLSDVTNLTELAHATGYYDQSQFIKDIKYRSGLRPGDFLAGKQFCTRGS